MAFLRLPVRGVKLLFSESVGTCLFVTYLTVTEKQCEYFVKHGGNPLVMIFGIEEPEFYVSFIPDQEIPRCEHLGDGNDIVSFGSGEEYGDSNSRPIGPVLGWNGTG